MRVWWYIHIFYCVLRGYPEICLTCQCPKMIVMLMKNVYRELSNALRMEHTRVRSGGMISPSVQTLLLVQS